MSNFTGLKFGIDTQAKKLQNMFYTQEGDLYYLPEFGIDRNFFLFSDFQINSDAFTSYLNQKAVINNIPITGVSYEQKGYEFNINYAINQTNDQFGGTFGLDKEIKPYGL